MSSTNSANSESVNLPRAESTSGLPGRSTNAQRTESAKPSDIRTQIRNEVRRWFKPLNGLGDADNSILYLGLQGSPRFKSCECFFQELKSANQSGKPESRALPASALAPQENSVGRKSVIPPKRTIDESVEAKSSTMLTLACKEQTGVCLKTANTDGKTTIGTKTMTDRFRWFPRQIQG